ncbi:MAG TPA: hypothetical protein VFN15_05410, partial [Solirubrobacterales bacterium]|nr:hypothetical protein [Solirubrobacterales bacterium]
CEYGQAAPEWLALVAVVALALGALIWAARGPLGGLPLAGALAERLVCAVRLADDCRSEPALRASYGADLAVALRAHAPTLLYEPGMRALPVDYRRCREDACAEGSADGRVTRAASAERTAAFTHVIDCRRGAPRGGGVDCSGERAGNLYLQYWLYYPGSATAEGSTPLKSLIRRGSAALGKPTYHPDDWESYQVRIGPSGRFARASSHHSYSYELGGSGPIPGHRLFRRADGAIGLKRRPEAVNGWGPEMGTLYVSGGSHAGNARVNRTVTRSTRDGRLVLIPLARLARRERAEFAVTPPWRKRVFFDPEYAGTD